MKILIRKERQAVGEEAEDDEDSISAEKEQPQASLFTQKSTPALNKVHAEEEEEEEEQEKKEKGHAQQCKDLDWFKSFSE